MTSAHLKSSIKQPDRQNQIKQPTNAQVNKFGLASTNKLIPIPMVEELEEIVIVGGGIAGLATALALSRVGLSARVLERNSELRASGAALALFPNAWFALRALGVDRKLASTYRTLKKSVVTNLETGATQEFNFAGLKDREDAAVRVVHRKTLLKAHAEELPPDTIRFSSKLISIRNETQESSSSKATTILHLEDGTVIRANVVIGCDGVHSAVAQWLGLLKPMKAGRSVVRGLSVIPEGHGFEMELRQYISGGIRAGFVPLNSTDLYWFLVEKSSSSKMDMPTSPDLILKEVTDNLAKDFPSDFLTIAKNTDLSSLTWAPLVFRAPWSIVLGQTHNGNVTVAGDAMHPMTPEIGQGGCSALEDAVILARCLSQAHGVKRWPETALQGYVEQRRWRVAWIVACAWYSGRAQHSSRTGDEWWSGAARWFIDRVFYKLIFPRMVDSLWYDCGDLVPAK